MSTNRKQNWFLNEFTLPVVIILLFVSPRLSAQLRCEQLFDGTHLATPSSFFEAGLGITYSSTGQPKVHLKLSRQDINPNASLFKRMAARALNALLYPLSKYYGTQKLNEVVQRLENDERPISYKHKLAEAFQLKLKWDRDQARQNIPADGPMIMIGPHVRAGLDGVAMATLAATYRTKDDVLIVLTKGLTELKGIHENAILIDDSGSTSSRPYNQIQRERIVAHLKNGGAIVMFPAGENATKPNMNTDYPYDMSWKPGLFDFSTAVPETQIVPVFIDGQLSDSFHQAKLNVKILGQLHLPDEMFKQIGSTVQLTIGSSLKAQDVLESADQYTRNYNETADSNLNSNPYDLRRTTTDDFNLNRKRQSFLSYLRNELYQLRHQVQNFMILKPSEWISLEREE